MAEHKHLAARRVLRGKDGADGDSRRLPGQLNFHPQKQVWILIAAHRRARKRWGREPLRRYTNYCRWLQEISLDDEALINFELLQQITIIVRIWWVGSPKGQLEMKCTLCNLPCVRIKKRSGFLLAMSFIIQPFHFRACFSGQSTVTGLAFRAASRVFY